MNISIQQEESESKEYEKDVPINKAYGTWCEKSMSHDLTSMTDPISIILELYQNAESANATKILFKLIDNKLLVIDDGIGMNKEQINDNYLSLKKDIYNRRNIEKNSSEIHTHSFGGEGGKKAVSSLYKNKCLIVISTKNSSQLHIILYDINKSWGCQFQNPIAYFNIDNDRLYDIEISRRISDLITEESSPIYTEINKIKETSGFLIYGEIGEKFKDSFNGQYNNIINELQYKCNDNLKNCSITMNDICITHKENTIPEEYIEITEIKIWGKDNEDTYTITYTDKQDGKYYYKNNKDKKNKELVIENQKKNLKCLATFIRKDILNQDEIKKLWSRHMYKKKVAVYIPEKKIYLKRFGTILNTKLNKIVKKRAGFTCFERDVQLSTKTYYEWEPHQIIDRLFCISGDKLNPNAENIKSKCTVGSLKFLRDDGIRDYIVHRFKCKNQLFKEVYLLDNGGRGPSAAAIHNYYFYAKKIQNLYHKRPEPELNEDCIQCAIDMSNQMKLFAEKQALLVENDEYMNSLYIQYTMDNIYALKKKMEKVSKLKDELKCSLKVNRASFYYKLNTPVDKNGCFKVSLDGLIEGEIGFTNNSVQQRHPKANIQFKTYINNDGSVVNKGNKIAVEKNVIENISYLKYVLFGNDDHPNSTEIFRFPYQKLQEVREKIENSVIRYVARDNIFETTFT